ncbi:hypothetical protein PF002_g17887 [Phytophthora fragariae]|uniref:Integrase catalytic domain-containing protein n=1 Tax=Phytophthora fragariae TaxID=53985 RepID=A0A6A4CYR6_9STRA|nr:hypothetical protein PF003_g29564 [Phytophthora fragariae]KAE9131393.1 hypothetical protein PF006_g15537 [Phytophthora fragariae]KAE9213696.1 hypothetical protein PF002_g17887 [Phytophthora fragariae]KAE9298804.1 hypothetical protein PF001_g15761 [Phytophthora fragariae]
MSDERLRDWDVWVDFAIYAYNSGQHSTVLLSPNELMMGRRLRNPNDLQRSANVTEAGALTNYHRRLIAAMKSSSACAEAARRREQERQKRYYDRKVRNRRRRQAVALQATTRAEGLEIGAPVVGTGTCVEAGRLRQLSSGTRVRGGRPRAIYSSRFVFGELSLTPTLLATAAADIEAQLEHEGTLELASDVTQDGEAVGATTVRVQAAAAARTAKRRGRTGASSTPGRRRRRNAAGQYVLELEVQDVRPAGARRKMEGAKRWISIRQYDQLLQDGRAVEDPRFGEVV